MQLSHFWEAASRVATHELTVLWNPKVHYLVHKSSALNPILDQNNTVHTTP
jgi:hypothetical protein